jgi:hypothetical protein
MLSIAPTLRTGSGKLESFQGGCHGNQKQDRSGMPQGGSMSKSARYEWRDQQASLQERMKGFIENPGAEQMEALVAELHAYAAAARSGSIEIPERFITFQ